jgi:hypothetical protein
MKSVIVIIALFVGLYVTSPIFGFDEPKSFRGINWDSSPDDAKAIMKQTANVDFITDLGNGTLYFVEATEKGGLRIYLYFLNQKFAAGSIVFDPANFKMMEGAFRQRYGPPSASREFWVQNAMRARFLNREISWLGKTTRAQLIKYTGTISDSTGTVGKIKWFDHLVKKEKRNTADTAKGL